MGGRIRMLLKSCNNLHFSSASLTALIDSVAQTANGANFRRFGMRVIFSTASAFRTNTTPPGFQTSNIRIFDAKAGVWKVTFFFAPGYSSGVWVGAKQGDDIVLEQASVNQDGANSVSRLTFFDIERGGFEWQAETIVDGGEPAKSWTSSCKRRGN